MNFPINLIILFVLFIHIVPINGSISYKILSPFNYNRSSKTPLFDHLSDQKCDHLSHKKPFFLEIPILTVSRLLASFAKWTINWYFPPLFAIQILHALICFLTILIRPTKYPDPSVRYENQRFFQIYSYISLVSFLEVPPVNRIYLRIYWSNMFSINVCYM